MQFPILLTGFMSSGKTTLAAAVGDRLGYPSFDLDELITAAEGRNPREIIEQDGEERFRETETRVLGEILAVRRPSVIALGGGAWVFSRNRELIEKRGATCVWLDAPFELCWERIPEGGGKRPLARNQDEARILYEARKPYYALAHIRIQISPDKTVAGIAREIAEIVLKRCRNENE